MKYLLLVVYLFSASAMAGHCNKGASHDDHEDHSHSEMEKDSKAKKDVDAEETEATKDSTQKQFKYVILEKDF